MTMVTAAAAESVPAAALVTETGEREGGGNVEVYYLLLGRNIIFIFFAS